MPPLLKIILAIRPTIPYKVLTMTNKAEIIIGCIMVGISLASLIGLTLWAGRIIAYISRSEQQTARHLLKGLNGDR